MGKERSYLFCSGRLEISSSASGTSLHTKKIISSKIVSPDLIAATSSSPLASYLIIVLYIPHEDREDEMRDDAAS